MTSRCKTFFVGALCAVLVSAACAQDPFAENIRKTDALTPEQERAALHVPPGFDVQLVSCEPAIGKPMNMAFDNRGRLWITQSREYPFAAPLDKPARDKILILEDFDANGRARKVSTFAEGLNIPIGLYPYKNGVIGFSIPNIYYFQDTDGDGKADRKELILGKFGFDRDVHGLTSSFRRGYDGWIYADHGFNNNTTLTGKDGSTITMNSGNCYRYKIDGSHVEQHSWGQVNPFGLMFDPLGDLWSADCHSSPVYQLLRGAYYPSFGKPHDGLGFAPSICDHSHGSTAIAGMIYYAAQEFPPEYRGNTFIGNVMTCRINRDSLVENGSTRITKEEPDFLRSDDPWFRPVDLRLGPEGAIYMADFYNRIIGHYEVPLDHPGRDRERGRIWRIVYTNGVAKGTQLNKVNRLNGLNEEASRAPGELKGGPALKNSRPTPFVGGNDFTRMTIPELIAELGSPNISRRMLAMDELSDNRGESAVRSLEQIFTHKDANSFQRLHGLWTLQRLGKLQESSIILAANNEDRLVRVHAMRILSEMPNWSPREDQLAMHALNDPDPYVQRAAADALGRHPAVEHVSGLVALEARLKNKEQTDDPQLLHVTRMTLRNQLLPGNNFALAMDRPMGEMESRAIADVALGIPTAESGRFLTRHIQRFGEPKNVLAGYLRHIVRYAPEQDVSRLAELIRSKFTDDLDFQLSLFKSIQEGAGQRGAALSDAVLDWGTELAQRLLVSVDVNSLDWRNSTIKAADTTNPWILENRPSADGDKASIFISSLSPGGEKLTGVLKSKPFTIPSHISFFMAGHDGSPEKPQMKKNFIRLRDAESRKVLAQSQPPRNDTAQPFTWDLSKHAGKKGFIEITDGNPGHSFAWLAVGRFKPEVVPLPNIIPNQVDKRQLAAAELASTLHLVKLEPRLEDLVADNEADPEARAAAAKALCAFMGNSAVPGPVSSIYLASNRTPESVSSNTAPGPFTVVARILTDPEEPAVLRQKVATALGEVKLEAARRILLTALPTTSSSLQTAIALALASSTEGAESLLSIEEAGKAPAHLLQENSVKDRVIASRPSNVAARIEKLTANLPTVSAERQKIIVQRFAAFIPGEASAEKGAVVFKQNCALCHSVDGQGALIGPQLDGVGARGAERIMEDILDPNRSVDPAFRTTLLVMKDGDVQSGLFRREEGQTIILAQSSGKEMAIPKQDIAERRETLTSLMPDNFADAIKPADFNDLIAFLNSKRAK